jgi:hypothetical protein
MRKVMIIGVNGHGHPAHSAYVQQLLFMHHCIGTLADEVRDGRYCVYSIRRDGARVASAALVIQGARNCINSEAHLTPRRRSKSLQQYSVGYKRKQPRRGGETV